MRIGFALGLFICIAASAQVIPKDTVGPDHFWFDRGHFFVAKDHTNAPVWVWFYPGNRGWTGNVSYRTSDGTAVSPIDYDAGMGGMNFSYTKNPQPFNIPIHCDTNTPGEKTINADLFNPSGYPTGQIDSPSAAVIHVLDNTNGTVSFGETLRYASRSGEQLHIPIKRSGTPNGTITVDFSTDPGFFNGFAGDVNVTGNAAAGTDFITTNTTLTFGPGEVEKTVDFTVLKSDATNVVARVLYLLEDYGPNFHVVTNRMTVVIVPPTALRVEHLPTGAQISWDNCGLDFQLERCTDPTFSQCVALSHATNGNQCIATDSIAGTAFYRLKR